MIKYIVIPGEVLSEFYGRRIYTSAYDLMRLYGVNAEECIIIPEYPRDLRGYEPEYLSTLTILEPRQDGVYLPLKQ